MFKTIFWLQYPKITPKPWQTHWSCYCCSTLKLTLIKSSSNFKKVWRSGLRCRNEPLAWSVMATAEHRQKIQTFHFQGALLIARMTISFVNVVHVLILRYGTSSGHYWSLVSAIHWSLSHAESKKLVQNRAQLPCPLSKFVTHGCKVYIAIFSKIHLPKKNCFLFLDALYTILKVV